MTIIRLSVNDGNSMLGYFLGVYNMSYIMRKVYVKDAKSNEKELGDSVQSNQISVNMMKVISIV